MTGYLNNTPLIEKTQVFDDVNVILLGSVVSLHEVGGAAFRRFQAMFDYGLGTCYFQHNRCPLFDLDHIEFSPDTYCRESFLIRRQNRQAP